MRSFVFSIFAVAAFSSTSSRRMNAKLALVIAAAKARFSARISTAEDSRSRGRELMGPTIWNAQLEGSLNIREDEEVCASALGELYYFAFHRINHKARHLDSQIQTIHKRLMTGLAVYEATLEKAAESSSDRKPIDDGVLALKQTRESLADVRGLLKNKQLPATVIKGMNRLNNMAKEISLSDKEQKKLIPAEEFLDESLQATAQIVTALRKLVVCEFEAEMRHIRVKSCPRKSIMARDGLEKVVMAPHVEFTRSFSCAVILVRRLDVLIQFIAALSVSVRDQVALSRPPEDPVHELVDQFISHLRITEHESTVMPLPRQIPAEFPIVRSLRQVNRDSVSIKEFSSRYVSLMEAEELIGRISKLL